MTSGVLIEDGSRAIRVYESSKMCPEVISHLDFECEKPSTQHLTPHCKDTSNGLHSHMHKYEDDATFKMQAIWTIGSKNKSINKKLFTVIICKLFV